MKPNQIKRWLMRRGHSWVPREKPRGAEYVVQRTHLTHAIKVEMKPRSHWWKASDVITAPTFRWKYSLYVAVPSPLSQKRTASTRTPPSFYHSEKYWTLMVGNNSWPVNHESCHLALHCPKGNILPWHCILKTKWRPQHFGQSLATASFCPGRHLDPGSVNWRSRAVCAFFSLLHWIRIILGMWNVGWSKCFKSNRHCFMASNVTNVETESGPKIWERLISFIIVVNLNVFSWAKCLIV